MTIEGKRAAWSSTCSLPRGGLPTDEATVTAKLLPTLDLTFHSFGIHTLEIRYEETTLQRLRLMITQQGLRQ
jgi:hypothetical protein